MRIALFLLLSSLSFAKFGPPVPVTVSTAGRQPWRPVRADFNLDGVMDVAVANVGFAPDYFGSVTVLLGSKTTPLAERHELQLNVVVTAIAAADLNQDGRPDLALILNSSALDLAAFCVYPGTGLGTFKEPKCVAWKVYGEQIEIGDFNGDRIPDVAIAGVNNYAVSVLYGKGDGTFPTGVELPLDFPMQLASGDWDGDGRMDLTAYRSNGVFGALTWARAEGGRFDVAQELAAPPFAGEWAIGDLDHDRKPDVYIPVGSAGGTPKLFLSSGAGFREAPVDALSTAQAFRRARMADLDSDGDLDILLQSGTAWALINDGAGKLTSFFLPTPVFMFEVGDFNGDGLTDVFDSYYNPLIQSNDARVFFGEKAVSELVLNPTRQVAYGETTQLYVTLISTWDANASSTEVKLIRDGRIIATAPLLLGPKVGDRSAPIGSSVFHVTLPAGEFELTASFAGNATVNGSTSNVIRVSVAPAATSVRVVSAVQVTSDRDAPASFQVAVDTPLPFVNEGTIQAVSKGQVVGTAAVVNGIANVRLNPGLPLGVIPVVLQYSGTNFLPSSIEGPTIVVTGKFGVGSSAYPQANVARGSIATMGLPGLAVAARIASDSNWPTELSSVQVEMGDGRGGFAAVPLSYVGPNQINFLIPSETQAGGRLGAPAVRVKMGGYVVSEGTLAVADVAPGIYTANGAGSGVPAALAGLYSSSGNQDVPVFACSGSGCVPAAMSLGTGSQQLVLSLFGTGIRNRTTAARAFIGGTEAEVLYSGAQLQYPGLDQINVRIDKNLFRAGEYDLTLLVDGQTTAPVRIALK